MSIVIFCTPPYYYIKSALLLGEPCVRSILRFTTGSIFYLLELLAEASRRTWLYETEASPPFFAIIADKGKVLCFCNANFFFSILEHEDSRFFMNWFRCSPYFWLKYAIRRFYTSTWRFGLVRRPLSLATKSESKVEFYFCYFYNICYCCYCNYYCYRYNWCSFFYCYCFCDSSSSYWSVSSSSISIT